MVQMTRLAMRPMGMLRCGSLVSSAAVDTASKPTKAKKMIEAAATALPGPKGMNGTKFSDCMAGTESAMNAASAATLTTTSTALTVALSLVPTTSSAVTATEMNTAGRLIRP